MTLKEALRSPMLKRIWPWIFATFPAVVLLETQAIAPVGDHGLLFFKVIFLVPLLAAPFALVVLPVIALRRSVRSMALAWWIATVVYLPLAIGAVKVGDQIRRWGFRRLAERSAPLVTTIFRYDQKHGHPPASLDALVPEFLPAVPKTGIMAYPTYRYYAGDEARRFDGNPWVLVINTPSGGINFDQFMYFPLTNYPKRGYGGSLERIGDWAYVHE